MPLEFGLAFGEIKQMLDDIGPDVVACKIVGTHDNVGLANLEETFADALSQETCADPAVRREMTLRSTGDVSTEPVPCPPMQCRNDGRIFLPSFACKRDGLSVGVVDNETDTPPNGAFLRGFLVGVHLGPFPPDWPDCGSVYIDTISSTPQKLDSSGVSSDASENESLSLRPLVKSGQGCLVMLVAFPAEAGLPIRIWPSVLRDGLRLTVWIFDPLPELWSGRQRSMQPTEADFAIACDAYS